MRSKCLKSRGLQGLESLTRLRVLDVSNNKIPRIECLDTLINLEDLWLNDNLLDSWEGIYESLEGPRQTLSTIYLENNPIVRAPALFKE